MSYHSFKSDDFTYLNSQVMYAINSLKYRQNLATWLNHAWMNGVLKFLCFSYLAVCCIMREGKA